MMLGDMMEMKFIGECIVGEYNQNSLYEIHRNI